MTVLVFGQSGQVAQALARFSGVRCLSRVEADLYDGAALRQAIADHAPRAVINAAAYTAVDRAESEPELAQAVNAIAPGIMAQACADAGIPFVHISTDYVFDGSGEAPWREDVPTGPLGVYGASKLAGEEAVRAAGGQAIILRTAWVFSATGQNFVKTMLRLSETHETLRIVADQWGGPTPAAEIARTCVTLTEALCGGAPGGTYHYAGAPATTWAGFAREIFAQAGRATRVEEILSAEYPTPAQRPLNSRLDCAKLRSDFGITPPDWRTGLAAVLKELGHDRA